MSRDRIPRHHIACQDKVLQDTTLPVRWIYTKTSHHLSSECTPHHIICHVSVHHTTSPVMWVYITTSNHMSSEYNSRHVSIHQTSHHMQVGVHPDTTTPVIWVYTSDECTSQHYVSACTHRHLIIKWVYTSTSHHMSSECTHRHHITLSECTHRHYTTCLVSVHIDISWHV